MTAALTCDGCGRIVSERSEEGDGATQGWWLLESRPAVTAGLLAPVILSVGDDMAPLPQEDEEPVPPPFHFCSLACLREWAGAQP